jgi:protein MpaA
VLGKSAQGRAITAVELGDPAATRKILVIGAIHGDETAGVSIADRLADGPPLAGTDLWIVPNLNPDGAAAHKRQNADGVDLNRNFPWHWRREGQPGELQYSGPRVLSEPEARIAHQLISKLQPQITLWFHQPLGLVDRSGGDARIERRFARLTGLHLRRLPRYHGSAATWQNNRLRGTTAFVTELPVGKLSNASAGRFAKAVRDLVAAQD